MNHLISNFFDQYEIEFDQLHIKWKGISIFLASFVLINIFKYLKMNIETIRNIYKKKKSIILILDHCEPISNILRDGLHEHQLKYVNLPQ